MSQLSLRKHRLHSSNEHMKARTNAYAPLVLPLYIPGPWMNQHVGFGVFFTPSFSLSEANGLCLGLYIYTKLVDSVWRSIRKASAMDPGNTNSWHPPSGYQSHIPTDAVQQAGPSSAPDIHTFQGGSRYAEFPWTAEPQDMSTPVPSIPELTHRLSKTSEMDNKSTPGNRLQRASTSTLISATPAVARPRPGPAGKAQGGSGHENFPWASEPQIPMSVPFAQSRPPPSRRFSEYTAMLLAQDKISVGLPSIPINIHALCLCLIAMAHHIYKILRMDLVGGLFGASCSFRQSAEYTYGERQ